MSSTQRKVAQAFLDSFETLDADANIALRTADCVHTMAPSSLDFPPSMTNEQWKAHVSRLKPVLATLPVTAKEIFQADGGNKLTIWAESDATFRPEAKDDDPSVDWSYRGEYMFVLLFNDAGDRIERIVEFIDAKKAADVMGLMARARNNMAARQS